jgi:hypothetical protein
MFHALHVSAHAHVQEQLVASTGTQASTILLS